MWRVVDELLAEHKVEVHREALPPPALAAKLRDAEARLNASQQENAQLRTGLATAEGLVGALVTEVVDGRGILALPQPDYTPRRATPLVATSVVAFRATGRLLVSMKLAPGASAREGHPLEVEEALLVDAKGRRRAVLRTKQAASDEAGVRFAVEAEAEEFEAPTSWWLRLRAKSEATFFTVAEVIFPQLP